MLRAEITIISGISGNQVGIGCQFVKTYNTEIPGIQQHIFKIRFVSNIDIYQIAIACPGQHHIKAQVWSFLH